MATFTKVMNTILIGLAIGMMLLFIATGVMDGAEAKVSPQLDHYDIVYDALIYYFIFWCASIVYIFTVLGQKIKTYKKVLNFILVTIVSFAMLFGMFVYMDEFDTLAKAEGMDTQSYTTLMSPELSSYVFNGILIYGILVVVLLFIFLIKPFTFKKLPTKQVVNAQNQQVNPQNQRQSTQNPQVDIPMAKPQYPNTNNVQTNPQINAPEQNTSNNTKSPFEV